MPLRHVPRLAACPPARPTGRASFLHLPPPQHRPFHCSCARRNADDDGSRNHYEILNVRPHASAAEIKKSFYALSKTHHPDHNPLDPAAPERFMRISAAYTVLSSPDKRAAYDRDVMHARHHRHHHHPAPHRGSYSSTGPAGGRPASGLSRRRSTFTGPPPSFYRSGGWGVHGAKRSAAHEESTGGGGGSSSSDMGGMGPSHGHWNQEVPHFDADSHERTHRRMERRRRAAAPDEFRPSFTSEPGVMASFFIVSAALLGALLTPVVIFAKWDQKKVRGQQDRKVKPAAPT
ncbi:hypothetical protein RB597_003915 [Gaeumannomyces tritici]